MGTQPKEMKNPTSQSQKRGRTQEAQKTIRAKREATSRDDNNSRKYWEIMETRRKRENSKFLRCKNVISVWIIII